MERYGVKSVMQSKEIQKIHADSMIANHGVDNPSKMQVNRDKTSARTLGAKFWNDGTKNYLVPTTKTPEPHWIPGMKPRKSS